MKRVKNIDVLTLLISLMPAVLQITSITTVSFYRLGFMLIPIIYFIIVKVMQKDYTINKEVWKFMIAVTLSYLIIPLCSLKANINGIMYYVLLICFVIVVYIGGTAIYNNANKALKYMFIFSTSVLSYQILTNLKEINSKTIMGVINGSRLYRAKFGYGNPNSAAMMIVFEIILIYACIRISKYKKCMFLINILLLIPLMATGSRTGVLSVFIFFGLELLFSICKNYKNKNKLFFIIFFVLSAFCIYKFGTDIIQNSSGRDKYIIENLKTLVKNKTLLFGIGGASITNINESGDFLVCDNWYVTTIITSGLVGGIIILSYMISVFYKIFKNNFKTTITKSIIIMMCIYGMTENVLFIPGMVLSCLLWTCIFYDLKSIQEEKKYKIKVNNNF